MPKYQMSHTIAKAIAASQSTAACDVGCGSCSGMASTRSIRLLYPRIADHVVALPSTVEVCQVQTHAPQQLALLDHLVGAEQNGLRYRQAELFRRPQVDDEVGSS